MEAVKLKLPTSFPHNKPYFEVSQIFVLRNGNLCLLRTPQETLAAERGSSDLAGSTRVAFPTCHGLDVRNKREGPGDSLNNRSLLFWIFPNPKTGKILKTNPLIMAFPFFMRIQHIPNLTAESFIRMKPLILKSKRNVLVKWIWELKYYFCLTAAGRKLQDCSICTLPFLLHSPANSPTLALSPTHSFPLAPAFFRPCHHLCEYRSWMGFPALCLSSLPMVLPDAPFRPANSTGSLLCIELSIANCSL